MSVPFLTFTCDSCDYGSSSFVTFGEFLWNYDGQTFNIEPQLGLCRDCKAIVAMEKLPDADVMDRAREIHSTYTGPQLFRFQEEDEAKYLASQQSFIVLERVMKLQRPPVCLQCGGSGVQPLILPELPDRAQRADIALTPLEVKHPGCGGEFQVQGSGKTRISLAPVTYYFNIEGKAFATLNTAPSPREKQLPQFPGLTARLPTKSQDWRPDWGTFVKRGKLVAITFEDRELNVFPEVDVVEEWEGCFRIYGYAFSDFLYWGDLFEGEFDGYSSIHFKRLLDRPEYLHFRGNYLLQNAPAPGTKEEWAKRFPDLKRAFYAGGYWEHIEGLGLYVTIPRKCRLDFPEFDRRAPKFLNEPPDDVEIHKRQSISHEGETPAGSAYSYVLSIAAEKDRNRRVRKLLSKIPD